MLDEINSNHKVHEEMSGEIYEISDEEYENSIFTIHSDDSIILLTGEET